MSVDTKQNQGQQECRPWLLRFRPNPSAALQLFCFPYAGVGASAYFSWAHELAPSIELLAVQLPGREDRIREKPFNRLSDIVPLAAQAIRPLVRGPYAFFGHSMGALIAFEVTRYLRAEAFPGPAQLFVSARRAPPRPERLARIHHLPEAEFLAALRRRWNGIPPAVLREPELLQLVLPSLRADMAVIETYTYTNGERLDSPISVFGAENDKGVDRDDLQAWGELTNGFFRLRMFPGDHFFIRSQYRKVARAVSEDFLAVLDDRQGAAPC
ncbi:MAG: alpha/beta fold hydrolase [Acidobacteriia bacterium]|nr:alpha/beta fold hydrolase [Terriglobia bacterium]